MNTNIDKKYDIFKDTITHAINKHLSIKQVKIHKHKHRKLHWITKGIIRSSKFRDNLYMQLKKTHIDSIEYRYKLLNLKTYNTIIRKIYIYAWRSDAITTLVLKNKKMILKIHGVLLKNF